MDRFLDWLSPYYFYPEVVVPVVAALAVYTAGLVRQRRAGEAIRWWPALSFYLGVVTIYAMMHTGIDYLAQYLFTGHRAQHLMIHHHLPLLVVLGGMGRVMPWGVPAALLARMAGVARRLGLDWAWRVVTHPVVAGLLFLGAILTWLTPEAHFRVMLDIELYRVMNLSVVITGLLFWHAMLNPRGPEEGGYSFGLRLIWMWLVMMPQILLGAYIALVDREIYDVYDVCGRAFPLDPMLDQRIGGLLTWVPAAEMMALVAVLMIRLWMREDERRHVGARGAPRTPPAGPGERGEVVQP